jgi:tetratricopeptide (TPR) repeat protein
MDIKCPKCKSDNPETATFCADCGTKLLSPKDIGVTKTIEKPVEELTRGTTLADRYEIIEELGKGGMGTVYRVEDTKIGQDIALKLIKPEIASDKKTIERFRNELKTTRMISHRNVCRMFDLGDSEGTYFITMEYIPGEDLKSFIRRVGQLPSGKAISIAKQVCEGLAEAHRLGVVHRDLKASNIMIDKEGNARIMDFGIARSIRAKGLTGEGIIIGTPEYMSPEQAEAKEIDHRSDIYSVGVILYEMVTGQPPFEGDTPLSIAMKHKGEIPKDPKELNPQIPEDFNSLILKCLEKDKDKRYQSAEELDDKLSHLEIGLPTTEKTVPRIKPLTSREITVTFGIKKLLIPAFVVIAIIVAAVIVWRFIPKKEVALAPKIENSIAIISFENQTGDIAYDYLQKAIPNLLITNLENTGLLYVATWERMHDLLRQMGQKDVENINRDLGFEICRREGIESIVTGSFVKAGDTFVTDVKILDVETKKLIKGANVRGRGEDSILQMQIDELTREISQGIGIAREKIEAARLNISDVTTNSMEAYNYFLNGREACEKWYWSEARKFLEKAIELDPAFASAYRYLSYAYSFLQDTKARNEAVERARIFSNRVTGKERLHIEAEYASWIEQDQEKSFQILKQLTEKYPKEKRAHHSLGAYYGRRNYEKAIEEYNKALALDPSYGWSLVNLAYIYAALEQYNKALDHFKKYASISPGNANALDSLGDIYFLMGRLEEALAKFKETIEVNPDFHTAYHKIGYIYALKEDYAEALKWVDKFIAVSTSPGLKRAGHLLKGFYRYWLGSLQKSLVDLQRSADLAETVGDDYRRLYVDFLKGWIYYDRGEVELSRKYHKSWLDVFIESYPEDSQYYKVLYNLAHGLIDLKQGRIKPAKTKLAEMKSVDSKLRPYPKELVTFYYNILHAQVLLAEGSSEKAIAVFERTSLVRSPDLQHYEWVISHNVTFLNRDILAQAYQQKGETDKAISEYERLLSFDPKSKDRQLIHPRFHYRLAKLYEEKDWKGKAIEHYEKFLDLWKDADPGIAEVEDARKRLAGLKE